MPITLNERIAMAKDKVAKLEKQQRLEKRRNQIAERKKNSQRHYIIGELVAKYFPEVQHFEPGTKVENVVEFEPIEIFLSTLATDQELIVRLKEIVKRRLLRKNQA